MSQKIYILDVLGRVMTSKYPRKYTTLPNLSKASEKVRLQAICDAHEEINYLKSEMKAMDKLLLKSIRILNSRLDKLHRV